MTTYSDTWSFSVRDKVVLVTGGTGVLGSAMSLGLARRGAKVVLIGRSEDKAVSVISQFNTVSVSPIECGGEMIYILADVTDESALELAATTVISRWGRIDALVNGAGGNDKDATVMPDQSFFNISPDALKRVMDLNWYGTVLPCKVFGRFLSTCPTGGVIVNISSMAAQCPISRVVGYASAKAAIDNFTKWLSSELCLKHSSKIRVNAIAPGFFLTEQNRFLLTTPSGELTSRGEAIVNQTPMRRFGEAEELVGCLVWLLSSASRFVTGTVVNVDGGFSGYGGL